MSKSDSDLSPFETVVAVIMTAVVAAVTAVLVAALVVGLPLGLLWGLNTLFSLGIPITWKTVGAAFVLCWVARQIFRPRTGKPAKS